MPYAKTKKSIRRVARKTYRKVVKPYVNKKKGYNNRMKLYKEINMIKKMVNAEKKQVDLSINGQGTAQLINGIDGIVVRTIIPTISQGDGYDNRNGRSIKLSGAYLRGKFVAQTNTINKMKFNMTLVRYVGKVQSTTDIASGMFNQDSLSAVRDYFAPRNPDSFTDYRIIASRNYTLYPDSISGQTGIVDFLMPLKLTHHIRYQLNTNTIEEGEVFVIIRSDSGDCGTANTGAFFSMTVRLTYYDN